MLYVITRMRWLPASGAEISRPITVVVTRARPAVAAMRHARPAANDTMTARTAGSR
jgi:hypothetical protein